MRLVPTHTQPPPPFLHHHEFCLLLTRVCSLTLPSFSHQPHRGAGEGPSAAAEPRPAPPAREARAGHKLWDSVWENRETVGTNFHSTVLQQGRRGASRALAASGGGGGASEAGEGGGVESGEEEAARHAEQQQMIALQRSQHHRSKDQRSRDRVSPDERSQDGDGNHLSPLVPLPHAPGNGANARQGKGTSTTAPSPPLSQHARARQEPASGREERGGANAFVCPQTQTHICVHKQPRSPQKLAGAAETDASAAKHVTMPSAEPNPSARGGGARGGGGAAQVEKPGLPASAAVSTSAEPARVTATGAEAARAQGKQAAGSSPSAWGCLRFAPPEAGTGKSWEKRQAIIGRMTLIRAGQQRDGRAGRPAGRPAAREGVRG